MQTNPNPENALAVVSTAKHNKVIAILCFLLLVAGIVIFHQYRKTQNLETSLKKSTVTLNTVAKDVKRNIDKDGNEHFIIKPDENQVSKEVLKFSKVIDTVALAINQKKNDITDYTKVALTASDKDLPARVVRDTVTKKSVYKYNDKLFNLTYKPGVDSITPGTFDASVDLDLTWVNYRKRTWILGALHSYTDIYSNDKRVKFKGANTLSIKQDEPSFGLRVRATSTYNFGTKTLSLGPEAAFDFGRNQIRVNYYYNPSVSSWRPSVTYSRDFLRL